ncbi:MAG: phosphohydrolase [Candidatus Omnitrophica bacterium]|nr:phosphohydrolase [Candidatus Omnitrophota bacterium]
MFFKCPGQDKRNIKAEIVDCHHCGYKIEFFSDEVKARCPQCKSWAFKEILPSCLNWCKAAGECSGII